jgi:hypothetical protein
MPFSDSIIKQAWKRAGGMCECKRLSHGHQNMRCSQELAFYNQCGKGIDAWEAYHLDPSGGDILTNCEILCLKCLKKIRSFSQ